MRHRIVIHGCYDGHNFGDLLMLDMIRGALRGIPETECVCPWERVGYAGKVRRHGKGWWDIVRATAGVYGGGGYLHANARSSRYYLPARIWQARRVPYIIIGVGVGPQMARPRVEWVRALCEGANLVCVRDEESKKLLQVIGVADESVRVTADIVLSLTPEQFPVHAVEVGKEMMTNIATGKRLLGLHFPTLFGPRHLSGGYPFYARSPQAKLVQFLEQLSELLKGEHDIQPVWLFDSCRHGSIWRASQTICKQMLPDMVFMPYYDHWSTAYALGMLHGVITTKLHVGIVAWAQGVPCCAYASHGKIARFYRQIGRSDFCCDDSNPISVVIDWVRAFITNPTAFAEEDITARSRLSMLAAQNIELLKGFVNY